MSEIWKYFSIFSSRVRYENISLFFFMSGLWKYISIFFHECMGYENISLFSRSWVGYENVISETGWQVNLCGCLAASDPSDFSISPPENWLLEYCTPAAEWGHTLNLFHRRRIYLEEKAKVVAVTWGKKLLQFLATLAILHQNNLKNMLICTLFFNKSWCKSGYSSTCPGSK